MARRGQHVASTQVAFSQTQAGLPSPLWIALLCPDSRRRGRRAVFCPVALPTPPSRSNMSISLQTVNTLFVSRLLLLLPHVQACLPCVFHCYTYSRIIRRRFPFSPPSYHSSPTPHILRLHVLSRQQPIRNYRRSYPLSTPVTRSRPPPTQASLSGESRLVCPLL